MKINAKQLDAMMKTVSSVQNWKNYGADIEYINGISAGTSETHNFTWSTRRTNHGEIELSLFTGTLHPTAYHRGMITDAEIIFPSIGGCKLILTDTHDGIVYLS